MGDDEQPRINTYNMCRLRLIDERIALYVENSHVRLIPLRGTFPLPLYAPGSPLRVGSPLAVWTTVANPLTACHGTVLGASRGRGWYDRTSLFSVFTPPLPPSLLLCRCQPCTVAPPSPPTQWGLLLGCPPPRPCPPAAVCQAVLPSPPVVSPPPGTPPASIYLYDRPYLLLYNQKKRYHPCLFMPPVYVLRACGDHGCVAGALVACRDSAAASVPQRSVGAVPQTYPRVGTVGTCSSSDGHASICARRGWLLPRVAGRICTVLPRPRRPLRGLTRSATALARGGSRPAPPADPNGPRQAAATAPPPLPGRTVGATWCRHGRTRPAVAVVDTRRQEQGVCWRPAQHPTAVTVTGRGRPTTDRRQGRDRKKKKKKKKRGAKAQRQLRHTPAAAPSGHP